MRYKLRSITLIIVAGLIAGSCSSSSPRGGQSFVAAPEPWRKDSEVACLNSGAVQLTSYIRPLGKQLSANQHCQAVQPLLVSATAGGRVRLKPAATMQCGMVTPLERWMNEVVQPAAVSAFGTHVVELKVLASYACRPMNSRAGGKLSEHGRANAIDIGAFRLADGTEISLIRGWRAGGAQSSFLKTIHSGACRYFGTVLGPNANAQHADHFHLDRARRRNGRAYCE